MVGGLSQTEPGVVDRARGGAADGLDEAHLAGGPVICTDTHGIRASMFPRKLRRFPYSSIDNHSKA